jgi:hypothetical protein
LEFLKDLTSDNTIVKELYLEQKPAEKFYSLLGTYFKRLSMHMSSDQQDEENIAGEEYREEEAHIQNESEGPNAQDVSTQDN